LTIASTTDVRLINNTSTSPLPIVGTEIPIAYFYWLAPAILVAVYLYLQLYLARLWKALGYLPAVFPDGAPLDRKIYPWLLNGLVRIHFDRLRRHWSMPGDKLVARVEAWISAFLAWWLVPVTLIGLWLGYLPRHDWSGTVLQVFFLTFSIGLGLWLYGFACRALGSGNESALGSGRAITVGTLLGAAVALYYVGSRSWWDLWRLRLFPAKLEYMIFERPAMPSTSFPQMTSAFPHGTALLEFLVVFTAAVTVVRLLLRRPLSHLPAWLITAFIAGFGLVVSWGAIEGHASGRAPGGSIFPSGPSTWISDAFLHMGLATHAVLIGGELSTKPPTWTDLSSERTGEIAQVRGALLANQDLRFAEARSVFLVNANLLNADLRYSSLVFSDLRGALLFGADLRNTDLRSARLQGACLATTKFDGSALGGANLTKADLSGADLRGSQGVSADMLKGACVGPSQPLLPDTAEFRDIQLPLCNESACLIK
jgi:hypothetical protein